MNKDVIYHGLFWFTVILGFILLAWYIVGDSPLIEQVFAMFLVGYLFRINTKVNKLGDRLHTEIIGVRERLTKLEESGIWIKESLKRLEAR